MSRPSRISIPSNCIGAFLSQIFSCSQSLSFVYTGIFFISPTGAVDQSSELPFSHPFYEREIWLKNRLNALFKPTMSKIYATKARQTQDSEERAAQEGQCRQILPRIYNLRPPQTASGVIFPGDTLPLLMLRADCSLFTSKLARSSVLTHSR